MAINVTRKVHNIKITHPKREIVVKRRNVTINLHDGGRRGLPGPQGDPGTPGANGQGIPTGGEIGEVIEKTGVSDYDTGWSRRVKEVIAGDNVTVDDTDPEKPIISAEASGGGAIGDVVEGASPFRVLTTNGDGELADDRWSDPVTSVLGVLDIDNLKALQNPSTSFFSADATLLGSAEMIGVSGLSTKPFGFTLLDLDTINSYMVVNKSSTDSSFFGFWPGGQVVEGGQPTIGAGAGGLSTKFGTGINEFSTDGTLAGNSDDALPTEKAVKTYVDANIPTTYPPGGSDGEVQYNNGGVFAGTGTYYDDSKAFPNLGIGISSPISPLHIAADPGNISNPALLVDLVSTYDGGTQQSAAQYRITAPASPGAASFNGMFCIARTGTASASPVSVAGFQGEADSRLSGGTLGTLMGSAVRTVNSGAGDVRYAIGMQVFSALNLSTGFILENVGIAVADQTAGTVNYAIRTGLGRHRYGGAIETPVITVTADTTLDTTHHTVLVDASGGNRTITLPNPTSPTSGRTYYIKRTDSSGNTLTVDAGSANIDGSSTYSLALQYKYVAVQTDGSNWFIISNN